MLRNVDTADWCAHRSLARCRQPRCTLCRRSSVRSFVCSNSSSRRLGRYVKPSSAWNIAVVLQRHFQLYVWLCSLHDANDRPRSRLRTQQNNCADEFCSIVVSYLALYYNWTIFIRSFIFVYLTTKRCCTDRRDRFIVTDAGWYFQF